MKSSKVQVKVFKFTPLRDRAPRFDVYTIDRSGMIRVSDLLEYIYQNLDRNLAFRKISMCRFGVCSGCRVRINGHPKLSCLTPLDNATEFVIEPVAGYQIVRDLVVDFSKPVKQPAPSDGTAEINVEDDAQHDRESSLAEAIE